MQKGNYTGKVEGQFIFCFSAWPAFAFAFSVARLFPVPVFVGVAVFVDSVVWHGRHRLDPRG